MDNSAVREAIRILAEAKDLGWRRRGAGQWTRLLQFPEALQPEVRKLVVTALVLFDGPAGIQVLPGEHIDELSTDGRHLRLRVKRRAPHLPPGFYRGERVPPSTYTPGSLFGARGELLA